MSATPPTATATAPRQRPLIENVAMARMAAEMLRTPHAVRDLDLVEAAAVVGQMQLVYYPQGATLLREGDDGHSGYLLLVLDGWVTVDTGMPTSAEKVDVAVLGPGSIIGEMALLDGAPRSANCTASSAVQAAGLSRIGLERLIDEEPRVAAKLLVALATRISDRLRTMGKQLQMYADLVGQQQAELDHLRGGLRGGLR
jgi:CRP-like cAMP-binding protein